MWFWDDLLMAVSVYLFLVWFWSVFRFLVGICFSLFGCWLWLLWRFLYLMFFFGRMFCCVSFPFSMCCWFALLVVFHLFVGLLSCGKCGGSNGTVDVCALSFSWFWSLEVLAKPKPACLSKPKQNHKAQGTSISPIIAS